MASAALTGAQDATELATRPHGHRRRIRSARCAAPPLHARHCARRDGSARAQAGRPAPSTATRRSALMDDPTRTPDSSPVLPSRRTFLHQAAAAAGGLDHPAFPRVRGRTPAVAERQAQHRRRRHRRHGRAQPRALRRREHRGPLRRRHELRRQDLRQVPEGASATRTTARCSTSRRTSTRSSSPRPTTPTPSSPWRPCARGKHVYVQKPMAHSVWRSAPA